MITHFTYHETGKKLNSLSMVKIYTVLIKSKCVWTNRWRYFSEGISAYYSLVNGTLEKEYDLCSKITKSESGWEYSMFWYCRCFVDVIVIQIISSLHSGGWRFTFLYVKLLLREFRQLPAIVPKQTNSRLIVSKQNEISRIKSWQY